MVSEKYLPETTPRELIVYPNVLSRNSWAVWSSMFVFWTLISSVVIIQDMIVKEFYPESHSHPISWFLILNNSLPFFYTWFALTPLIFWFGRRFSFEWNRILVRNLLIHLILCLGIVALHLFFITSFSHLVNESEFYFNLVFKDCIARFYRIGHFEVLIYWAILGSGLSLGYYEKYRRRKVEALYLNLRSIELEGQLARAQLDSLRMQLNPHFLFNTLHAISTLVEQQPKRAVRMIARLGTMLRWTLDTADQQQITLEREIALTTLYLDIERERFGESLQTSIEIQPEVLDCSVPSLILQPLVENAVKHGIAGQKAAIIEIKVSRENDRTKISVEDNGPGFKGDEMPEFEDGIGLRNTAARLERLYGDDHEFKAFNAGLGGARIEISIPFVKMIEDDENKNAE